MLSLTYLGPLDYTVSALGQLVSFWTLQSSAAFYVGLYAISVGQCSNIVVKVVHFPLIITFWFPCVLEID